MSIESLAAFIFRDRLAKLATGEGGIVDPVSMSTMDKLMLEEWALSHARKHKTRRAYLRAQARGLEELKERVAERHRQHALEGQWQGLAVQAQLQPRPKKLLN